MEYDPDKHKRHSIRLPGYDYSEAGAYFLTVVAQDRACLFGEILDGTMVLSDAGRMVEKWWFELRNKFPAIEDHAYVIMPNHLHAIIIYAESGPNLGSVLGWFKTMTTNEYIRGVKQQSWPAFRGKLWQRNYYEHIIRDEDRLNRIREYIVENPAHWATDTENPSPPNQL